MAYLLKYQMRLTRNDGTEQEPNIVEYLQSCVIHAADADYDKQMTFAKAEAYNGVVISEEVKDAEPITSDSVWDELDAAYQEGVDSV